MKMKFNFVLMLLLVSFSYQHLQSQVDINNVKKDPNYLIIKNYYEKMLKNNNNDREDGNKWIKRWIWNNRLEANNDGSFKFLNTSKDISKKDELKVNSDKLQSQSGWIPVGPVQMPPSYEPRSCYSMGRINCVAFHPTKIGTFWIGTPGGGVWKTENEGKSWTPLTDDLTSLAVSSIAVDPQNPYIIYFAAGDYDTGSLSGSDASGIFKSSDGGLNWEQTSLILDSTFKNSFLRKIIINPVNTQELITAGMRGMWKSSDAGVTWKFINDSLYNDLEIDPVNPQILYAATGTMYNYYGSAGIFKSTDFGETWNLLTTNIPPQNAVSRIDIAVSPVDPNYIYALCVNSNYSRNNALHSFYQSTDAGISWELRADYSNTPNILGSFSGDEGDVNGQGTYDLVLQADPTDKNKVYTGGINMWMSENGGKDWEIASFWIYCFGPSIHADHHYAAYNPLNKYFYWCNDGGIYRTQSIEPGSKKWITDWVDRFKEDAKPGHPDYKFPTVWENLTSGLAITEFYRLGLCKNNPGNIAGGSQDNSCFYNNNGEWVNYIANYDGMETMVDHDNPQIIYGVWQGGGLCKSVDGGKTITIRMADTIKNTFKEDGNWITPVAMDPVYPEIIYIGFRNLWRSTNGGFLWEKAFNLDSVATDSSNTSSITIVKTSFNDSDYMSIYKEGMWFYYSNTGQYLHRIGEFWITTDGGKQWVQVKQGLPIDSMDIVSIDYDKFDPKKMWVVFDSFYPNINTFMTSDGGLTWKDVSKFLPNTRARTIVHQPSPLNTLYIGTNKGVYYTNDSLITWIPFSENLPNCIINKLEIENNTNELYAATYGRGIWKTNLIPDDVNEAADNNTELNIFPNPNNGNFVIDFTTQNQITESNLQFEIIDMVGRVVFVEKAEVNNNSIHKEIMTNLESGIYFVKINLNGRNYTAKLILRK
jgi:photosystem II stability/assembly factor-like uncharacterized protein